MNSKDKVPYSYKYYMAGFSKWKFMPVEEGRVFIERAIKQGLPVFQTIHNYAEDGETRECPIYIDLDGRTAQKDCKDYARKMYEICGTFPKIWFSGSKGYHLVIPYMIREEEPEKIVKFLVSNLLPKANIDPCVYSKKRMWRVEGSRHNKTGLIKKRVFEFLKCEPENINEAVMQTYIDTAKAAVKKRRAFNYSGDPISEMVPCVQHIIEIGANDGEKHNSIVEAAKFWKCHCGDPEDLIAMFSNSEFWEEHMEHIEKTVASIFASSVPYSFGCNKELLRNKCKDKCKFRKAVEGKQ